MGPRHVKHLSGSERAKLRLSMILKTMLGELTVAEACAQLQVCESRFHALRNVWLQEALECHPLCFWPRNIQPSIF